MSPRAPGHREACRPRRRSLIPGLALAALLPALALSAAPAAAHVVRGLASHAMLHDPHARGHVTPLLSPLWSVAHPIVITTALLALAVFGLTLLRRYRNRALLLALALGVGFFTLETGVHSIHHMADPAAAAQCTVLTVSEHVSWGTGDVPDMWAPAWDRGSTTPASGRGACLTQPYRPHSGRAPPRLPSL